VLVTGERRAQAARPVAVARTIAGDAFTPILAYRALGRRSPSCLLESVEQGGRQARYSYVGLDYRAVLVLPAGPDAIDRIRAFVHEHRPDGPAAAMGGALIVAAYDAARPFAGLAPRRADPPEMPDLYVAIPSRWLIFDHLAHTLTLWASDDREAAAHARLDEMSAMLLRTRPYLPGDVHVTERREPSLTRDAYLLRARRVLEYIRDGEVYQLQLGIRFGAAVAGDPFDLYRRMRARNPSPYQYYVEGPFGSIFGASPEFLVRLEGRTARIRPLAGTRPRGATPDEDQRIAAELTANPKERAEHVMLVDLGRNDLGSVCDAGSVYVGELMQIERYSHVMHIVSEVRGTLREGLDGLDLFVAGFPAGTVTGTPKVRAMQLIDELEPCTRGIYAGSVGRWSFDGDFDSCIALRGMHVRDGIAWWQASAGIVADSDPVAEYEEVLHKTRIARSVLEIDA
jgi:anthranilate synthase component 1